MEKIKRGTDEYLFLSLPIQVSSVQVCISIQHFSPPLNSKSTCESRSSFSFVQTFHLWVTDEQRSAVMSLQGASVKAISLAWILVFWYWISCTDRQLTVQTEAKPFCSLSLAFSHWCTAGGPYTATQSLSDTSYWVYSPRVFLSHMFACV